MAAWNVTICPSASSLLKMSSKNRVEQVLGMVPSPAQLSPRTIRGGEQYMDQLGGGSPKRPYYAAFAEQMGDEEVMVEEEVMGAGGEGVVLKKRRLSSEQVRYLESSFESENKLEPERKAQIAQRLGLQPRQVAVWFQNRRARSKSKQLERDFNALKAEYHAVLLENEKLQAEVDRLTAQLREGSTPPEGGHTAGVVVKEMKEVKRSASNGCSSNCGSVGVKVEAEAEAEAEASTASGEVVRGNELGDGEEQSSPCTILVEENVDVNIAASVLPLQAAAAASASAAMRARVAETANYEALMAEDIHLFTNCMQQVYAHQLVDFYTTDTLHYDFIALDDPWSD